MLAGFEILKTWKGFFSYIIVPNLIFDHAGFSYCLQPHQKGHDRVHRPGDVLDPKLIFVTGLEIFITAVARLVCPYLLG